VNPRGTPVALAARGVTASLDGSPVLRGIDLELAAGCWTSIVGPNGAGKSTLLKVLANLLPHEGQVTLAGQPIAEMPARMRARKLSWLGQYETSGVDLTVYDVTMLGRLPHQSWLATASALDVAAVERALRATQAWDWRARALGQLSGGERQRVLLARALAVEAEVLLMDEPLANLDPPHQADWLALVRGLAARGKTVVSVLHEISMALQGDTIVIMAQGRVQYHGAAAAAATQRALEQVFDQRITILALGAHWVAVPNQGQATSA